FPRLRRLGRCRGCARQARLSIEQLARLQHNIPAGTRHHGATCASARLLRVAARRCAGPRDRPISLSESSNPRIRAPPPVVEIAPPRNRDAYKPPRMMPRFAMAPLADREYPAAWLNQEPADAP